MNIGRPHNPGPMPGMYPNWKAPYIDVYGTNAAGEMYASRPDVNTLRVGGVPLAQGIPDELLRDLILNRRPPKKQEPILGASSRASREKTIGSTVQERPPVKRPGFGSDDDVTVYRPMISGFNMTPGYGNPTYGSFSGHPNEQAMSRMSKQDFQAMLSSRPNNAMISGLSEKSGAALSDTLTAAPGQSNVDSLLQFIKALNLPSADAKGLLERLIGKAA